MPEKIEGMIPVNDFARSKGITPAKAVDMIRDGFYVGRKVGDDWFVNANELSGAGVARSKTSAGIKVDQENINGVVITDIQMSFSSMVSFMVKWALASIPAMIILTVIFLIVTGIFGGIFVGASSRY